jgi:cyclic pyranopterin monophosphate synthase
MNRLTHLDESGAARMVDVTEKAETERVAIAEATISLSVEAFHAVVEGTAKKGDIQAAARIAGIMAAKKTSELIPLCHPIALTQASIEIEPDEPHHTIRIVATVKTAGKTGVEMEALTAAGIAALTIYDMTKAIDKASVIESIRLLSKSGGKSGNYRAVITQTPKDVVHFVEAKSSPKPAILMGETSLSVPKKSPSARHAVNSQRVAFRTFMTSRRLRATQWAKDADVSVAQIYAFLTGKTPSLPGDVAEKLARAASSRVEDMFR